MGNSSVKSPEEGILLNQSRIYGGFLPQKMADKKL
jgi:hypothetical protein